MESRVALDVGGLTFGSKRDVSGKFRPMAIFLSWHDVAAAFDFDFAVPKKRILTRIAGKCISVP